MVGCPAPLHHNCSCCSAGGSPGIWSWVVHFTIGYAESTRAGIELVTSYFSLPSEWNSWTGLVWGTRSGQFVDMRELLMDNVSLHQQLDTFGGHHAFPSLPGMLKPRHEMWRAYPPGFIASWHITIQANDQGVWDMLVYARLMVREVQRHGGSSWLDYDRVFHQQAALDPSLRWNTLHPEIQATTLVGRTAGSTLLCSIQTTLQGSMPFPTSSLPLGPPMLLVRQFGHLALGLLWDVGRSHWQIYSCPGPNGVAPSRAL